MTATEALELAAREVAQELGFEIQPAEMIEDICVRPNDESEATSAVVWCRSAPGMTATFLAYLWKALIEERAARIRALIPQCAEEGWISVEERLPVHLSYELGEQPNTYLCAQKGRRQPWYITMEIFGVNGFPKYVTHWRPLPSPPAAEAEEQR